ncbi:hypothetical protein [Bacillus paramycoides]|uniref:hypothetical protein n=1 Tax=Bacillus paramycoides TaxID=2026194 RepID=UPI003809BC7F
MKFEPKELNEMELDIDPDTDTGCCSLTVNNDIASLDTCDILPTREVDVNLSCTGRILNLTVNIGNVCPNIPLNVAVVVCTDETTLGMKVFHIDAQSMSTACTTLVLTNICFAIPGLCDTVPLIVKVVAQYAPNVTNPNPPPPTLSACSVL